MASETPCLLHCSCWNTFWWIYLEAAIWVSWWDFKTSFYKENLEIKFSSTLEYYVLYFLIFFSHIVFFMDLLLPLRFTITLKRFVMMTAIACCHGHLSHELRPRIWCAYLHKIKAIITWHQGFSVCFIDLFMLEFFRMDIFRSSYFSFLIGFHDFLFYKANMEIKFSSVPYLDMCVGSVCLSFTCFS